MKVILSLILALGLQFMFVSAQVKNTDSLRNARKDSTLRAKIHDDSVSVEKQFAEEEKWDKIFEKALYPLIKESKNSGVLPVSNPTEVPDPNMDYKLLFELVEANPDSVKSEINFGLAEVARIMNLHVAAGIPAKRIIPVIVVHGPALWAIATNEYFKEKKKIDNPNLKIIAELEKAGAKIIACGQAMQFFEFKREEILPEVKISITAQTVLSSYQLKGYVLYSMSSK